MQRCVQCVQLFCNHVLWYLPVHCVSAASQDAPPPFFPLTP